MTSITRSIPGQARKEFALSHLQASAELYKGAAEILQLRSSKRAYFARLARQHGVTLQQIADTCGISESAVRQMLKRAEGENPSQ